jgi:hypothetical protein
MFIIANRILLKYTQKMEHMREREKNKLTNKQNKTKTKPTQKCLKFLPRPSPEYSCGKRNPLDPILSASFVSIVLYPIIVLRNWGSLLL